MNALDQQIVSSLALYGPSHRIELASRLKVPIQGAILKEMDHLEAHGVIGKTNAGRHRTWHLVPGVPVPPARVAAKPGPKPVTPTPARKPRRRSGFNPAFVTHRQMPKTKDTIHGESRWLGVPREGFTAAMQVFAKEMGSTKEGKQVKGLPRMAE